MKQNFHELVLATTNLGKLKELQQMLIGRGVVVRGLADFGALPAAPENADTFKENARRKALYYTRRLGDKTVLADDSGLEVDALNGAPGVHSARFAPCDSENRARRDAANNTLLLQRLSGIPHEKRTARFRCCLCICRADDVLAEFTGAVEGIIANEPRGENGFGYDP
ncbi:MAG: non-canonical purine NTP pyrophosphatase, partial [Sedimentisphaerales bacterium]|nr:non-canonical purine NTP pyrophosphatase [Sedimentisphaerales bacterium]